MKKQEVLKWQKEQDFYQIYASAHNNAIKLLSEAEILYEAKKYARAYFLAFTALEEISKSQLAADAYTGLIKADKFWDYYKSHDKKINRMEWATLDANEYPDNIFSMTEEIMGPISKPKIRKRMNSLYISITKSGKIIKPESTISTKDAKDMIYTANVAIDRILLMTEYYGHQIGTKGFLK